MHISWQLIEAFVHVAEAGSLTAAAQKMRISQPTLSRHVQELEEHLGVQLFVRHARGLTPTDRGVELLEAARDVHRHVDDFLRQATGLRSEAGGTVRLSINEAIGIHALGPCYAALRRDHPRIALELVIDNSPSDLSRREADIAVRMCRPRQPDLVAKRIGRMELGLFASAEYVEVLGMPANPGDVSGHTLIGFDRDGFWHEAIEAMGLRPEQFALRTDSVAAQIEAIRQGVGIGAVYLPLAARTGGLVRVLEAIPMATHDIWLVVHQDVRGNPAVRAVLDALTLALQEYLSG